MSARSSKLNIAAEYSALVFAIITGLTGHLYLSIAGCLLGAALCVAVIWKDPRS